MILETEFKVVTIVYFGKQRKYRKDKAWSTKLDFGFVSRLHIENVLAPCNVHFKTIPLAKCAKRDVIFKIFNFLKKENIVRIEKKKIL